MEKAGHSSIGGRRSACAYRMADFIGDSSGKLFTFKLYQYRIASLLTNFNDGLPLQRAHGDSLHKVALEQHIEDQRGNGHQNQTRKGRPPIATVLRCNRDVRQPQRQVRICSLPAPDINRNAVKNSFQKPRN
jgi:hypothetical protein